MRAVELREITKRFGAVVANAGVNLQVEHGSIHGVIGENGAGKTTAMNLLYGMYQPDAGEILIDGKQCHWKSPRDAIAKGIGMVHQHFMLAGPCSALDNIVLGAEPVRWGLINRGAAREKLEALADQYGLSLDLLSPIEQLPIGLQQRVEILKLLYRNTNILILDEPSAVLTPQETGALFQNLKKLRAEGKTVILVTHKLREVTAVADRVTVFRAGSTIAEMATCDTNAQDLAELMIGRKVSLNVSVTEARPRSEAAIQVSSLTVPGDGRNKLSRVSFTVHCGEIVGIAGVEGNGQSELVQALLHPRESKKKIEGRIEILGREITNWKAEDIRAMGVAVIPEDRQQEGLLLARPLSDNFLLGLQRTRDFKRGGFVRVNELQSSASRAIEKFDVRPRDLRTPAEKLSGGNQQKLVIAREFHRKPVVIIAAQPTRGVDVGAIEFIHGQLVGARDSGAGVLLVSSDLDEILSLSDRILVIYEGRIVAQFDRGQVSERELGIRMVGGEENDE